MMNTREYIVIESEAAAAVTRIAEVVASALARRKLGVVWIAGGSVPPPGWRSDVQFHRVSWPKRSDVDVFFPVPAPGERSWQLYCAGEDGGLPPLTIDVIPVTCRTLPALLVTFDLSVHASGYEMTFPSKPGEPVGIGPIVRHPRVTGLGEPIQLLHPVTSPLIDPLRVLERVIRLTRRYGHPVNFSLIDQLVSQARLRTVVTRLQGESHMTRKGDH